MSNASATVFACAPTYREPGKIRLLLESLRVVKYRPFVVRIVNACPGDETSRVIAAEAAIVDYDLAEIAGDESEYWSGTINRALREVRDVAAADDWALLLNVDIAFDTDVVTALVTQALLLGRCQVGALSCANGRVVSSAVTVRSWALGLNRHPLAGRPLADVPAHYIEQVDFLPSRCLLVPAGMLQQAGIAAERALPHYGADYEFTHRLIAHGCRAFLVGDVRIEADVANTGASVFSSHTTFWQRVRELGSIRNPSNVRYRARFLCMTYPIFACPTALLSYAVRTVLEVCLGGERLRRLLPGPERGFSR